MEIPDCTCTRLRRAARVQYRRYEEALSPAGLTAVQYALLKEVGRTGPESLNALAAATAHGASTLDRNVRMLERDMFVQLGPVADRRGQMIAINDPGKEPLAAALRLWKAAQSVMVSRLAELGHEKFSGLPGSLDPDKAGS